MNLNDVLYISKNNRSCNLVYPDCTNTINQTVSTLLNNACVSTLSTLSGRVDAIKTLYNIKKSVPIFIESNLIFQPVLSNKAWNQVYINVLKIYKLEDISPKTRIVFVSGNVLDVDISMKRLSSLVSNCLMINDDQSDNKMKRGKILWQRKISEILI